MGLAVLPSRLKAELAELEKSIVEGKPLSETAQKHNEWLEELKEKYTFTNENTLSILKVEVGKVFSKVLEHAGVYKRTPEGVAAFKKFVKYVNSKEQV